MSFIAKLKTCQIFTNLKILVAGATAASLLVGCAIPLEARMMPRDSGNVFIGKVVANGINSATMEITVNGENYTGLWVSASAADSSQLILKHGSEKYKITQTGTGINKGIFTSSSGKGLRCESTATGMGGAGICLDDSGRVYDILVY